MFNNKKTAFFILILTTLTLRAEKSHDKIIAEIKNGNPNILKNIQYAQFKPLLNYKNRYYYIPAVIGQKSLRSLLGCLKNSDGKIRKICADYMYHLKVSYLHKKYIYHFHQKEEYAPARLSLQDLLLKINMERFLEAKRTGDASFLSKIKYSEISDFIEKGLPENDQSREKEIFFYRGGLRNIEPRIRSFSAHMLFELSRSDPSERKKIQALLKNYQKSEANEKTKKIFLKILQCFDSINKECYISPHDY